MEYVLIPLFNQIERECSSDLNEYSAVVSQMRVRWPTPTTLADVTDETRDEDPSNAGWVPVPGVGDPLELFEMDDLDLLAHVTHPIRGAILRRLKEPRTVAEVAAAMDAPVTRLYHHVNKLEESGLIRVVATRQVAAVTERRYQAAGRSFRIARSLVETSDDRELALALSSLFDVAKLGFQRTVESGRYRDMEHLEEHSILTLGELALTPDRRKELIHRLRAVVDEFHSELDINDPAAEHVALFIAAYPETS